MSGVSGGIVGFNPSTSSSLTEAKIDFSGSGSNTIVAAVSGQVIRVHRIFFVSSLSTTITFVDGSTALTGSISLTAGGSVVLDFQGDPWFTTTSGAAFVISQTGSSQISGRIYYRQVDPQL